MLKQLFEEILRQSGLRPEQSHMPSSAVLGFSALWGHVHIGTMSPRMSSQLGDPHAPLRELPTSGARWLTIRTRNRSWPRSHAKSKNWDMRWKVEIGGPDSKRRKGLKARRLRQGSLPGESRIVRPLSRNGCRPSSTSPVRPKKFLSRLGSSRQSRQVRRSENLFRKVVPPSCAASGGPKLRR